MSCSAVGALLVLLAALSWADEMGENPEYANWSRFKAGTRVRTVSKSENLDSGNITVVTQTTTLIEVGKEKIVVEIFYVSEGTNRPAFQTKPKNHEIPRTMPLPKGVGKEEFEKKLSGTVEEGTEIVKTDLGEFATRWYKTKADLKGYKTEGKTWVCDDVPGGIVRVESKTTGLNTSYKTRRELIEIKRP